MKAIETLISTYRIAANRSHLSRHNKRYSDKQFTSIYRALRRGILSLFFVVCFGFITLPLAVTLSAFIFPILPYGVSV